MKAGLSDLVNTLKQMEAIKRNVFWIILIVFAVGCVSGESGQNFEDLSKIEKGMTIKEVGVIMRNDPMHLKVAHWSDSLLVESYESPAAASDDYKIIYQLLDSTVVEVRWGD